MMKDAISALTEVITNGSKYYMQNLAKQKEAIMTLNDHTYHMQSSIKPGGEG